MQEAPVSAQPASSRTSGLTAHDIYVRDAPGVLFVRAQVIEQVQDPFNLFPQQQSSTSTGSGFLIDRAGDILTNFHVIEGADRTNGVTVQFEDNVTRKAVVVGVDQNNDLALLKVDMTGVTNVAPLILGDSTTVRVGDPTLAIGNPFGYDRTLGWPADRCDRPRDRDQLADRHRRRRGQRQRGDRLRCARRYAKGFLPRLETGGEVKLAWLGVSGTPASRADRADRAVHAVVVARAEPGGPASAAGLRRGDAIQAIDGHRVTSMESVQAIVELLRPGQTISVRVGRGTAIRTLHIALGSRPEQAP